MWLLRPVGRSLITMGALYVGAEALAQLPTGSGLPPGHPERLCPDLPLTLLELQLELELAQLMELERVMGRRARPWNRDTE
ncbi:DUF6059 family protein [Streptacidiphilus albus]|uniref:DUF6059 family protein n=1 Tax=Streptacidiphilus albus TaxID=105425 RepID=UPI000AA12468|nr:DUF6059 family protein [Streptacidiphilus albus]